MKKHLTTIITVFLMTASAEAAQSNCPAIENDLDRLACHDKESGRTPTIQTIETPTAEVTVQNTPLFVEWKVRKETSTLTDETNVFLSVQSNEEISCGRRNKDYARLHIRCLENTTSIILTTSCHMTSSKYDSYGDVMYRLDNNKAKTVSMQASTDNEALGLWRGGSSIPMIKNMFDKKNNDHASNALWGKPLHRYLQHRRTQRGNSTITQSM